ncbi:MAG: hypothetical protein WBF33_28905 [Candidatus Nitrosopolaris sp.]
MKSRFRCLHLPRYSEEKFLEVSAKVLPKLKNAYVIGKAVYFNNHYGGKAVVNPLQFKAMIEAIFISVIVLSCDANRE